MQISVKFLRKGPINKNWRVYKSLGPGGLKLRSIVIEQTICSFHVLWIKHAAVIAEPNTNTTYNLQVFTWESSWTAYWDYVGRTFNALTAWSTFCVWHFQLHFLEPLRWRHNGHDSVSNHWPRECLLNSLIRCKSKKTSKLRVTALCAGNSPETGEFPA